MLEQYTYAHITFTGYCCIIFTNVEHMWKEILLKIKIKNKNYQVYITWYTKTSLNVFYDLHYINVLISTLIIR